MKIPVIRKRFGTDAKRLRRARKLYAHMYWKEVLRNPELALIVAQRAKARGLYAESTPYTAVVSSVVSTVYRRDTGNASYGFGWFEWLEERGFSGISSRFTRYGKNRHKFGKPVLRLVA